MSPPIKFAVLSHILPPSDTGQAVMLWRLLESFKEDEYILISSKDYSNQQNNAPKSSQKLSGKYFYLAPPDPTKISLAVRLFWNIPIFHRTAVFFVTIRKQSKQLGEILEREQCATLVSCTGSFFDMFVAYLAIRKTKIRFIIYSFDDYVLQWVGFFRLAARLIARFSFKRADELIVPNEFLQREYLCRLGKDSVIVRNPIMLFNKTSKKKYFSSREVNIVYTGSVYFAHFDAFRNLIHALEKINFPIKLHIFSGQDEERLRKNRLMSERVVLHSNLEQSEALQAQKQADILFLPLAFKSRINEVIRTSAPGKMGEYLASGRPILAHVPSDSFVSWYFKKTKSAVVVDKLDCDLLKRAIKKIAQKKLDLKAMAKRAKVCAREDFSPENSRKNFISALEQNEEAKSAKTNKSILDISKNVTRCVILKFYNSPFFDLVATIMKFTADNGWGSDRCLKKRFLPLPVHFYSPIPDISDLKRRKIWQKKSALDGIDFNCESQLSNLEKLGEKFARECIWPLRPTENEADYFVNNNSFGYGCAASLYSIIRQYQPARIIEIGSGQSSKIIAQALQANSQKTSYKIIDPFPPEYVSAKKIKFTSLIKKKVELMDSSFFDELKQGDILFIDSSHSVKIGGDVNFLYLEVLPRLKQGVIIHIHDISLPYEYSEIYSTSESFRQFWTEQYLLQSFLCHNNQFEILLAMHSLMVDHKAKFERLFPYFKYPGLNQTTSGSFWMRKK